MRRIAREPGSTQGAAQMGGACSGNLRYREAGTALLATGAIAELWAGQEAQLSPKAVG